MLKKYFSIILSLLTAFMLPVSVAAYEPINVDVAAKCGMLVSLDTNEILYEKNIDDKVYPASITKIMTVTLMLESDRYQADGKIAMSADVDPYITGTGSAVSNLKVGEEITQLDLVYYVLMSSCGDCAYLAALYYGGTVENFLTMMNDKAKKLGMTNTHYSNPVGLHEEGTYTTVRDIRTLTEYALKNETFQTVCSSSRHKVAATNMSGERTLSTTNFLLDNTTNYYYHYANGVKTGFTDEAGRCLVSTASYNGYNYLCILMNSPNGGTRREFTDSRALYRWAFESFEFKQVADTEKPVCEAAVDLSFETDHVPLYIKNGFVTILPVEADASTIVIRPILDKSCYDAPIKKGQKLGTAEIVYAEKVIGKVDLIAGMDVHKSKLLAIARAIKQVFTSVYMKLVYVAVAVGVLIFILIVIRLNRGHGKKRRVKYIPYNNKKED